MTFHVFIIWRCFVFVIENTITSDSCLSEEQHMSGLLIGLPTPGLRTIQIYQLHVWEMPLNSKRILHV